MIGKDDIIIRKTILHVLDTIHGDCILSNTLLDPGPDLYEFIRTHIFKIFTSDDTKKCTFYEEKSPIYPLLSSWDEKEDSSFIETSQEIAQKLYYAMHEGPDIPPADLLFVSFQAESIIYLALLKMNYKESYTHQIAIFESPESEVLSAEEEYPEMKQDLPEEEPVTLIHADIVKSKALLPAASSRIPEAVIINLSDLSIQLLEKRYEVNGEKVDYLSENFLVCHTNLPAKKKLNILTRVVNNITNKYEDADMMAKMKVKSALQKTYLDQKQFDIEEIGQKLFGKSPERKAEFDEKMESYDLQYDTFSVTNESTLKNLEKQVMVTDSGIEISIPMDTFNKVGCLEIKTDSSGKSTIIIKDIDNLIVK